MGEIRPKIPNGYGNQASLHKVALELMNAGFGGCFTRR